MKHLITFCMAMLCSLNTFAQYDLNGDGKVDVADISAMVSKELGHKEDSITSISLYKNGELVGTYNNTSAEIYTIKYNVSHYIDEHEWVDLGLPSGTLWAKTNIGAEKETDYGLYFAWGETVGYTCDTSDGRSFDWASYKWMASGYSNDNGCIKYTSEDGIQDGCWYDNNGNYVGTTVDGILYKRFLMLESNDDAATANWGVRWRMPSYSEIHELINNTSKSWVAINGVQGYKFANKTDANIYIFLPAAGYRENASINERKVSGYYWSYEIGISTSGATRLNFDQGDINDSFYKDRCNGLPIRAVCTPTK